MKKLIDFIYETRMKGPDVEKFLLKNKKYVLDGLNKYYGGHGTEVTDFDYKYVFSGNDSSGNPMEGIYLTYKDNKGKFNQDAYISFDGYIVNHDHGFPEYDINKYYRVLPDLKNKLKI